MHLISHLAVAKVEFRERARLLRHLLDQRRVIRKVDIVDFQQLEAVRVTQRRCKRAGVCINAMGEKRGDAYNDNMTCKSDK
jgi:hypothetical protein